MSGLSRNKPPEVVRPTGPTPGLVDPTVELTQPGTYPYGDTLLTDGAGGWTIGPSFRPYYISFSIPDPVPKKGTVVCWHQGVSCANAGPVVMSSVNLIGISVSLGTTIKPKRAYRVEIFRQHEKLEVLGVLEILKGDRGFRRDLSVEVEEGSRLGARIIQVTGRGTRA